MQKKLIALAVAAGFSGAAFAQSNVTISGLLDVGVFQTKNNSLSSSLNAGYNNTATSNLTIRASEDLGGGKSAGVVVETDLRGPNVGNGQLGSFQRYVFLNWAGIGELSMGQRTNLSTATAVTATPFGTAIGSGYGGGFTRLRGGGFEATGAWSADGVAGAPAAAAAANFGGRDVRPEGTVHFRSANFSGFTFGLDYKPRNPAQPAVGTTETAPAPGYWNLGAAYANGPLNLSFAESRVSSAPHGAAAATPFTPVAGSDFKVRNTLIAGNYTMGAFTGYLGWTRSRAELNAALNGNEADSRSWNVGLRYVINPAWTVAANFISDNDKTVWNQDRKMSAVGVDYNFSRRTATYFRYQRNSTDAAQGVAAATDFKARTYGVGLRHSF